MQYIVIMEQNGGCDYTIGCGQAFDFVEATPETLHQEVHAFLEEGDRLGNDESSVDEVYVYPVGDKVPFDLAEAKKAFRGRKAAEALAEKEAQDHAEYRRLRARFDRGQEE
jgi:hypothetical protein